MDKHITLLGTINNYFQHLYEHGYLNNTLTMQTLFAVLLIDCLDYFQELVTVEFLQDVNRILHNLECCVCTIGIGNSKDNCSC